MTVKNPKVSVITPTFNRPDYLREAIESVINQEFQDWEMLIMNDGGVDVAHVVAEFDDSRLRYFPDDVNKGASHRYNFGLKQARADYITYLGDDDKFYPNHVKVLSRALDKNPKVVLVYSDLYAVSCIKDESTGKRYALDKKIQVCRDFNREFMFYYNHILQVSLMHRKDAAFRVGCYDESIKVVIEWSLNRRLCFFYDFLHVPEVTGEYYMPVVKSDRISVRERRDKESYRHNIRKIKSYLPKEKWTKIERLDFIFPVVKWDEFVVNHLGDLIDHIDYPSGILIVNNGTGLTEEECWQALGKLAEMNNIRIITSEQQLKPLDSFRLGALNSSASFLYLLTDKTQFKKIQKRIFGGLEKMKQFKSPAMKWDVTEEKDSPFDMLIKRKFFLKKSDLTKNDSKFQIGTTTNVPPSSFVFDLLFSQVKRAYAKGRYDEAYRTVKATLGIAKGAPGIQFLIGHYFKICLALKKYDEVERELRNLIDRGFEPDNWIRLGQVLQVRNQPREAIEAYKKGLSRIGLSEEDLESPIFPFNFPKELSSFTALLGLAECYDQTGDTVESDRYYHRAAKLRANSHKPFLGFAKHFLASGQIDQAEAVLKRLGERDGKKDPETHRVLGKLCYRRGQPDLAFSCYLKAFEVDKNDEKNLEPIYFAGRALEKWDEVKGVLEEYLELNPDHVPAMARLSDVYYQLSDYKKARRMIERGLELEPGNSVMKGVARRLKKAAHDQVIQIPAGSEPENMHSGNMTRTGP